MPFYLLENMQTFNNITNGETGASVRGKLNNALTSIISGSEGINAIWAKISSVVQRIDGMETGVRGIIKDTSYNPDSLDTDKSVVLIALCTGTFNNIKDKNGTPITIPGSNAITIFYRAANTTYWEYATQEIFLAVDSYESNAPSKIENAKTHVLTHRGTAIKPMTDFASVFDTDGNSLVDLSLSMKNTTEMADTALRIINFDGIVNNVKIEEQGVVPPFSIYYDMGRGFFVAWKAMKYYSAFLGSEKYNTISGSVMKARADRLFLSNDDGLFYHYDGTKLTQFILSYEERVKLYSYPPKPLEIPTATTTKPGLMSAADKKKLNKTKPVEEVTWTGQHHMNGYTEFGEFHIKGERTNANDGLPILNAASGYTIDATLTVLDSSLTNGTGKNTDVCVTQILRMSNRTGGDGHIFVRTGQAATKSQLASGSSTYWAPWEKLMGMFEKNAVTSVDELDTCTTNGMYSGIFASTNVTALGGINFRPGDTFLMITANGYAATPFGTPQLTQILFKFPVRNAPLPTAANMYLRVAHWDADNKKWAFENFTRMATDADLSSQVATLMVKINQNSANISSATDAASEALTTAQEAQAAANSASENAAQAQELANESKTAANAAQELANSALSEAIEGKSAAANAFGAANNAQSTADAAQDKNTEQDTRLDNIEARIDPDIAGRVWNEDNGTPTAESYYGSVKALRDLPKRLGLGRYLVTDDRKRKKLDPKDSTKYLDGSPAALDGSEGQCMWCWNGFYANVWHEGSRLIKAVTFDGPVGGETSVWIPAGGISWLGAGVMDRENNILCSLISDAEQYRGGNGAALNPASYAKAPAADSPQITMLGMPATYISTTNFGNYARKRGEGWEANWFVARFVVEFLFEVIMGTENSQAAFNAEKDANGLYQGGFGMGVTDTPNWGGYNGTYPVIPTSVGLEAGDGVCLVSYKLPQTDGAEGEVYHTFNVPVFFGLVGAGFGILYQWTRGLIMDAGEEKSLVYVTTSMYADYDPNTVEDKILVAECPRASGYIKRKSYQGLCCMPTEVGGAPTIRFGDNFSTNADTSKGLRVRAAGGDSRFSSVSGASCSDSRLMARDAFSHYSAPLCYFEEDPIIPESEKIEI